MKTQLLILLGFYILSSSMTCDKISPPNAVTEDVNSPRNQEEPVTYSPTFREVPPPPSEEWRNIDISELDTCRRKIWKYLKTVYPIADDSGWDYDLYSVIGEPGPDVDSVYYPGYDMIQGGRFHDRYRFFFNDTIMRYGGLSAPEGMTCTPIDSTFFYDAVGVPTCKSFNSGARYTTFMYYIKWRWRSGPVPAPLPGQTPENTRKCSPFHFAEYPGFLRCQFDWETGKLRYMDWH